MVKRMPKAKASPHKWTFRARFRRNSFGWKSQPAIKRIKEALSEIKAVARKDQILAAEGAVLFLERVSPALEHVDSSSGAIGTAVNKAITALVDIIAAAPADEGSPVPIARACEEVLLSSGFVDEAYERYGLVANQAGTYAAWFRAVAKTYPHKKPQQILDDLVAETPGEEGKWFAAAKDAKLFDEAIALANRTPCSPQTLTRAARDFEERRQSAQDVWNRRASASTILSSGNPSANASSARYSVATWGSRREPIAPALELQVGAHQASLKGGSSDGRLYPGEPIVEFFHLGGRVCAPDVALRFHKVLKRELEVAQGALASREYAEKLVVVFFVAHHFKEQLGGVDGA